MWSKLILGLLPAKYRLLIEMGTRIVANLDSEHERNQAVVHLNQILADGKVTVTEWSKLGATLKIWNTK